MLRRALQSCSVSRRAASASCSISTLLRPQIAPARCGLEMLKINADQRYLVIRREVMPDRHIEVVSADAVAAFAARGSAADPTIERRDRVIVFSRAADRGTTLATLLDE